MSPEAREISSTEITLQWDTGKICNSMLRGFNLTYCEVALPTNATISPLSEDELTKAIMQAQHCIGRARIQNIKNPYANRFIIRNLKPYTIYRIQMRMYSSIKQGQFSDPLYELTKEDAPSPPLELQVLSVSNTSANISWLIPATANGVIRVYEINLNNKIISVPATNLTVIGRRITYKLHNLWSNHFYQVFVTAITILSSPPSNKTEFSTSIGFPQIPLSVRPNPNVKNQTLIVWDRPAVANGGLEFYEVAVTQLRNDEIIRRRVSLVNGTTCAINIPECEESEFRTKIDVRAVNMELIAKEFNAVASAGAYDNFVNDSYKVNDALSCTSRDKNAEDQLMKTYGDSSKYHIYRSDWSPGNSYNCQGPHLSRTTFISLLVVLSGTGAFIGIYIARNIYNKMSDIYVIFPPGLDFLLTKNVLAEMDTRPTIEQITTHNNSGLKSVVSFQPNMHSAHNEKRRLLSSNDSCLLDDSPNNSVHGSQCDYQKSTPIPSDYMRSISQSSSDSTVASSASTVVAETPLNYIKSSNILNAKEAFEQHELNNCAPTSNYVTLDNLNISKATPINGYINPAQFQKSHTPFTFVESQNYTTAEQLAKMNNDIEENLNVTKETRISGYVTPGDLNVFSKQQHRHGFDENGC